MCRWSCYLGHQPILLDDVLVNPEHAITKQVHDHYLPGLLHYTPDETANQKTQAQREADLRNKLFNIDGFGVCWYTECASKYKGSIEGVRPASYHSIEPALTDRNFRSITANTESTCILTHIRAATATAVSTVNNHPFIFGRHSIAHNGEITNFADIRHAMCGLIDQKYFIAMQGTTDSEHLAALYMTHLGDDTKRYEVKQMHDALAKTLRDIHALQNKICPNKDNASSLNVCVTDGQQLVAVRWRNSETEHPPSLYLSTVAGAVLSGKAGDKKSSGNPKDAVSSETAKSADQPKEVAGHGRHVMVGSEPTTFLEHDWKLIEKNHVVLVDRDMSMTVKEMVLDN